MIEKFENKEKEIMTKFERYNQIIKGFDEVRQIKPSPNEMHAFYDHLIEKENFTSKDVIDIINNDEEFKKIMKDWENENDKNKDVQKDFTPDTQTTDSNSIQDDEDDEQIGIIVEKSYSSLFPGEKLTSSNKDFLMYKMRKFGNDITRFEEYLTSDTEYINFIKKKIDNGFQMGKLKANDEKDSTVYEISTPNLNRSTIKKKSETKNDTLTCKDLEDEHVLARIVNERNLDELKYACLRSKEKYANVDENMVLLPDQKWSVPQKHPEICRMNNEFNYQPSTEQTSLIGTLLDASMDTQIGSILPEFNFEEK
jgi:hypothetical protein